MRRTLIGLAVIAFATASVNAADPKPSELRFADGPRVLDELPLDMYRPQFLDDGDASESWDYAFHFADTGYLLFARFLITNLGPGDHRAAGMGWIFPPDGGKGLVRNSRGRDDWKLVEGDGKAGILVGSHILEIQHPRHVVQINHGKRGTFRLTAEAMGKPFRLGRVVYDNDKYLDITVIAPRLQVAGMVQMPGEEPVELGAGLGVATVTRTNQTERKRMLSTLRFDSFDGPRQVSLFELVAPEDDGYQRLGALLVLDGEGGIEHVAQSFERTFAELEIEEPKPRYPVPGKVRLARAAEDGWTLTGAIDLELLHRDDIISHINSGLARWFAKRSLKARPVGYRFRGGYELRFTDPGGTAQELSGTGLATLMVVKPPPATW